MRGLWWQGLGTWGSHSCPLQVPAEADRAKRSGLLDSLLLQAALQPLADSNQPWGSPGVPPLRKGEERKGEGKDGTGEEGKKRGWGREEDELGLHKATPFSLGLNGLAHIVPAWNAPHPNHSLCLPSSSHCSASLLPFLLLLGPMALCMCLDFISYLCHLCLRAPLPCHCDPLEDRADPLPQQPAQGAAQRPSSVPGSCPRCDPSFSPNSAMLGPCELGRAINLSRPLLLHLQNGNNNTNLLYRVAMGIRTWRLCTMSWVRLEDSFRSRCSTERERRPDPGQLAHALQGPKREGTGLVGAGFPKSWGT